MTDSTTGAGAAGMFTLGGLTTVPASARPDLLAPSVWQTLVTAGLTDAVGVVEIDPAVSDTAATQEVYGLEAESLANCVIVSGKREGVERIAACVVLASTRADVNNAVRKRLDVRKSSFHSMERAVTETGMEYGGITPIGLPADWPVLVDSRVAARPAVIVGSGIRSSKVILPGSLLGRLPGAEIVEGLAIERA
ncbi:YbaK/EbsC family protein [Herbiconiux sp. 11R-BC]|uniref:YbaK/EbsC family protein n=1 Tax=Herbiconiux sp. 11R-BC TaxID=3111637 RepID=UPI003BFBA9B1